MRKYLLFSLLMVCLLLDFVTKVYFDQYSWQKFCYIWSPYIVSTNENSIRPTENIGLLIGNCSTDARTGLDFYESVFTDIYQPILGAYVGVRLSYNDGVAFSLPIRGLILQCITILLILAIWYHYIRVEYQKHSRFLDIGYILIIAWALSHAYERIYIGHVVDFIAVKYFAILNFADIFISVWVFLILFVYVRSRKTS